MSAQEEVVIITVRIPKTMGRGWGWGSRGEKKGKKAHSGSFFSLRSGAYLRRKKKRKSGTKQEMRRGRMK